MSGQGVTPNLIVYSCAQMFNKNFETIYARMWHSNMHFNQGLHKSMVLQLL